MSDDERKKKADEQDEDDKEGSASEDEDEKEAESEDDEDEKETASEDDEDEAKASSEDDEADEKSASENDKPAAEDAAAQRVADALGVGGEEEAAGDKPEAEGEQAQVQNRAARRAEAAQRRKKRKAAAAPAEGDDADEALPKDKNARAKALLKRRQEQAAASAARPVQLLPGEMVDDALARSASAVGKWLRKNFNVVQWVIVAAAVVGGGYALYASQTEKTSATASDTLNAGVRADRGRVMAEDKRSDDEKELDPAKVFKTSDERADTALASYRKVVSQHAGTGAALLARLGEGGALLDKRDWDHALEAFSAVAASTLAGADPDVKARALEGIGFAKEGKKDYDGAMATFKDLQGVDGGKQSFKELGQYHEARMHLAKGDKEKAKDLLKQIHTALEKPAEGNSNAWLKGVTDEALRRLDPTAVPPKPTIGGSGKGGSMSREDIDRALKKMQESLEKSAHDKEKH